MFLAAEKNHGEGPDLWNVCGGGQTLSPDDTLWNHVLLLQRDLPCTVPSAREDSSPAKAARSTRCIIHDPNCCPDISSNNPGPSDQQSRNVCSLAARTVCRGLPVLPRKLRRVKIENWQHGPPHRPRNNRCLGLQHNRHLRPRILSWQRHLLRNVGHHNHSDTDG